MGNCIQTNNHEFEFTSINQSGKNSEGDQHSLISRLEAVEGSLFLYRSVILRNSFQVQREVTQIIETYGSITDSFVLKRQKLYEAVLTKIELQSMKLRDALRNAHMNKDRRESSQILTNTYALVEDIEGLIKLEDVLDTAEHSEKSKESFEGLFLKYEVNDEEVQEMKRRLTGQFDSIMTTEGSCLNQNEVPSFLAIDTRTAVVCEAST